MRNGISARDLRRSPDPFSTAGWDGFPVSASVDQPGRPIAGKSSAARILRGFWRITKAHPTHGRISYRSVGLTLCAAEFSTVLLTSILTGQIYHLITEGDTGSLTDF